METTEELPQEAETLDDLVKQDETTEDSTMSKRQRKR